MQMVMTHTYQLQDANDDDQFVFTTNADKFRAHLKSQKLLILAFCISLSASHLYQAYVDNVCSISILYFEQTNTTTSMDAANWVASDQQAIIKLFHLDVVPLH